VHPARFEGAEEYEPGDAVKALVRSENSLPPVLAGSVTPENRARVESFYLSVASIFDAWVNRRISSLSSFYKFLAGAAAELRLPITVPNPAHAQFISREASDPVEETRALSLARARQLMAMPKGDSPRSRLHTRRAGERKRPSAWLSG
jgi:hypothetical protein